MPLRRCVAASLCRCVSADGKTWHGLKKRFEAAIFPPSGALRARSRAHELAKSIAACWYDGTSAVRKYGTYGSTERCWWLARCISSRPDEARGSVAHDLYHVIDARYEVRGTHAVLLLYVLV